MSEKPSWACRWWGGIEHDWLDCPECLDAYERHIEEDRAEPPPPKTTVVHCNDDPDHEYVGRPTKYGNMFEIGRDGTRKECVDKYRAWISEQPAMLDSLKNLRGRKLGCWCAPKLCHAGVLAELADRIDFRTGRAVWRCGDSDFEVDITGVMGVGRDGRVYLRAATGTGVPQDEIIRFLSENDSGEQP